MGISPEQLDFERIRGHVGHHVVVVTYGNPPVNAAIECETCGTVLCSTDPTTPAAQPITMWQVTLVQGGAVKAELSLTRAPAQWFAALPPITGFVLNKNETPFAPLYCDRYAQIKTR